MTSPSPSPHRQMGPGLTRYVSAPSSLLKSLVDSVINEDDAEFSAVGSDSMMGRFFSGDSSCLTTTSESTCKLTTNNNNNNSSVVSSAEVGESYTTGGSKMGPERSYGYGDLAVGGGFGKGGPSLIRHSSSPAGFLSQLMVDNGMRPFPFLLIS